MTGDKLERGMTVKEMADEWGRDRSTALRILQRRLYETPPTDENRWAWREGRSWRVNRRRFVATFGEFRESLTPPERDEVLFDLRDRIFALEMQFASLKAQLDGTLVEVSKREGKYREAIEDLRDEIKKLRSNTKPQKHSGRRPRLPSSHLPRKK